MIDKNGKKNTKGTYSGERMEEFTPLRAKKVIEMAAMGYGNTAIKNRIRADVRTVKNFRLSHVTEIEDQKKALRALCFPGAVMAADKAIELLPQVKSSKEASIMHSIFMQSLDMLYGQAPAKLEVEVSGKVDLVAQFTNLLAQAGQKVKSVNGQVIEAECLPDTKQTP